ncbi:LptF/LptG family permease [Rickettsiales endosymbiont of Stachyamoeba lipophora]|uniref:LptF/LptG family permease n=1 Tax=Rickettsiales endosymbiont of Stachyamoeba lipophora TaxID=2486578 RepID=UPI000F656151|nr:LptF/LptG family permease [Rickettsiales endosymbiont of Stachyamoeba lipophora]AZL15518.1 LptF/LptG family permease [Rickettsiales endosymbiont of Stachyamoeba lipophora]
MKLKTTLFTYIARQYLASLMLVTSIVASVISLVDSLELVRRSYGKILHLEKILYIVSLRLPYTLQEILPFICLIAATVCYARLSRNNELIIMRSVGLSGWQFMMPTLVTSIILGTIYVLLLTPLTSKMFYQSELIEDRIIRGQLPQVSALMSGIWLKDELDNKISVINAKSINPNSDELKDISIIICSKDFQFIKRIDAESAIIENGYWRLPSAKVTTVNKINAQQYNIRMRSSLTIEKLQESFNKPSNLSFWQLPKFISNMKQAGLPAIRHYQYFLSLCLLPLLLAAMSVLAVGFATKISKRLQNNMEIFWGILISFVIYFINQIIGALGLSGTIPLFLSVVFPVVIAFSVAALLIVYQEDA